MKIFQIESLFIIINDYVKKDPGLKIIIGIRDLETLKRYKFTMIFITTKY